MSHVLVTRHLVWMNGAQCNFVPQNRVTHGQLSKTVIWSFYVNLALLEPDVCFGNLCSPICCVVFSVLMPLSLAALRDLCLDQGECGHHVR